MSLLTNPPQPVPTPIRNYVAYEDRVAVLLNRAGSSAGNPVVGSNKQTVPSTSQFDTDKGASLRLKFGMATPSETITNASAYQVDTDGNVVGEKISLQSEFIADTTNNVFYADLIIGQHLPAGDSATRVFVRIGTTLNRTLEQQVYTRNAPDNIVTVNGTTSTQSNPLTFSSASGWSGESRTIALSFFPTWNDEIARQHGASNVALTGAISKPYGGMETVEIRQFSLVGGPLGTTLVNETPIRDVSSITLTPSGNAIYYLAFVFRSKEGSSNAVLGFAYISFVTTSASPCEDLPPDMETPTTGGGAVINDGTIILDPVGFGNDSNGDGNTSVDVVLTGYKGGTASDTGTPVEIANVASGTQTISGITSTGESTHSLTGDLVNAQVVVAEVRSPSGVKGNSIVYTTSDTDLGYLPGPPVISGKPSYDFSTNTATVTLSSFGFPDTDATIHVYPIYGGIENPAAVQTYSNVFAYGGASAQTATFSYQASVPVTKNDLTYTFTTTPTAVVIWASNAYGSSTTITVAEVTKTDSELVKKGPTLSAATLFTQSTTDDSLRIVMSDLGNQTSSFTLHYGTLPSNGSATTTYTATVSAVLTTQTVLMDSAARNVDGHYFVYVEGEQGNSATQTINNVAS